MSDVIDQQWPYDGPHDADTVTSAAEAVSALVHYLANATGPSNQRETLQHTATVHAILEDIAGAVSGLDQLLHQLKSVLRHQADDPTLYDDRRADFAAPDTARAAAEWVNSARMRAQDLAGTLDAARDLTAHLGNNL